MKRLKPPIRMALTRLLATGALASASMVAAAAAVETPGFLKFEIWSGLSTSDNSLDNTLLSDPRYPATPDAVSYAGAFNSRTVYPDDSHEGYAARLSGWITPQTTGDYRFFIYSDDSSRLFLSTDDKPANLVQIAEETGCCNIFTEPDSPRTSDPINLTAGKKYYVEFIYKEGGGGDYGQVAWRPETDTTPAASLKPISGAVLSASAEPTGAAVTITTQPASVSVPENGSATFTVAATATSGYQKFPSTGAAPVDPVYQWYENNKPVAGANGPSFTIPVVRIATDGGAKIKCLVAVPGLPKFSDEATLTVTADVTPPVAVKATPDSSFTALFVDFSEPVTDSALTAGNYALDKGATVSAAVRLTDRRIKLTTSKLTEATDYTLTINGVKDTATPANTIAANSKVTFKSFVFEVGSVLHRFWDNIAQNNIAGLTNNARYPDSPTFVTVEKFFEYGPDGSNESGSNYGNELLGWFIAPFTGNYVFFCSGDDPVNIFLSTDENPANAKLIAVEPQWNNARQWTVTDRRPNGENRSDTFADTQWPTGAGGNIALTQGKRYFIQALHTEGGGGDSVGATFIKAGDADPANGSAPAISGANVGVYLDPNGASVTISQHPQDLTLFEGRTATLSVTATGTSAYGPTVAYQWESAAAGSSTFTAISGATASSYTTPVLTTADSGKQYRAVVKVPTVAVNSTVAHVTVQADKQAPLISRVSASSSDALSVTFDESLDPATANTAANYKLSPGNITITKALLGGASSNIVRLETGSAITAGAQYTVTVNGVKDLFGNATANAASTFTARIVTYADIILADKPIAFYRFEETTGQKTANLGTIGAAADGLYMQGSGPSDSSARDAKTAAGPQPPAFLGFAGSNRAAAFGASDALNTDEWVDTQKQLLNGLGAFTLEYWVFPSGGRRDDPTTWPNRVGIVGQNDAIEYGFINPTTIQIWTPNGGSLDTTYSFGDNEWHHVATIASGTDIRNYFDGVLVGRGGSATGNYGTSIYNVSIGGGGVFDATGNFFTGRIDEVAIFDKAIPADRVLAHFKAGKEGGVIEEPKVPTLKSIAISGGNVVITFADGVLQSSPTLPGTWTDVSGATSPYSAPAADAAKYFRVRGQ